MFSIEEKKKLVEQGLEQFCINPKFRNCLEWFVDEIDKIYDNERKMTFEYIDNMSLMPPKSRKDIKLNITSIKKGKIR